MKTNMIILGLFSVTVVTLLAACSGSTSVTQATKTSIAITYPTAEYIGSTSVTQATVTSIAITYPTAEYTEQRTVIDNGNIKIEFGFTGTLPIELPRDVPIYYPGYPTDWQIHYSDKPPLF